MNRSRPNPLLHALHRLQVWAITVLVLAGCAAKGPTASTDEVAFEQAVLTATDSLVAQTQKLPGFIAKVEAKVIRRALLIDPMLEGPSGQQTALTKQLEERASARLRGEPHAIDVLPFKQGNLDKAQYLLIGTVARVQQAAQAGKRAPFQLNLALVDMKSGNVVAQASSRARDDNLDTTPTPYYRDSPVLVKDKVVEGYIRTVETKPGQAADGAYFGRVAAATSINDATIAYNAEKYEEANAIYKSTLATPAGDQLRTLNGAYLASLKLGNTTEAEEAFGKVVEHGIANNNLGVKFLFRPNSTEFWADPKISGPYALWLRQIARQAAAAKVCMDIIGHTSRTGGEQYNVKLSEQRAAAIRSRLGTEAPELTTRMKASGVGFKENIIGTGTDDASDALDRRVEFRIGGC